MHVDARSLPDHSIIEGDVCIVGAGAAGISMALDWIGNRSKVILLESGGFEYDDQVQDLYKGKSTGQRYYPLRSSRLSYFGGTTNHWGGMCSPMDNIDFIKRDWVPNSGWPISRADLDPYYARANEKLKLGPYRYDLEYWQNEISDLNPFPLNSEIVWHKMWQLSPVAGYNGGMAKEYKDSILEAPNIFLYTYATVVDLVANPEVNTIQEITIKNFSGRTHTIKAKHFILAGGAIQNARMLLSANKQAPKGLGNDHDLVGRFFMEHIEIDTSELWLFNPFRTDLFNWDKVWCELAIHENIQIQHRILNGTSGPHTLSYAKNIKPRMDTYQNEDPRKASENMFKSLDSASELAKKERKGAMKRAYQFQVRMEQAPNPQSRITIGNERDELGVPSANLHWQLSDLDKQSIRKTSLIIAQQVGISDIGRIKLKDFLIDENDMSWPVGTNGGWHHIGTTRMSDDPKTGVVDANCRVHGISNLFVAGSSCFTTSGASNPTLTLVALSLRLSDYIKEQIKLYSTATSS